MKFLSVVWLAVMSANCFAGSINPVSITFEKPAIAGSNDRADNFKPFWSEKNLLLDRTVMVGRNQYIGKSEGGKSLSSRFKGFDAEKLQTFVQSWREKGLNELVELFGDPDLSEAGMSEGNVLWQWSLWNQKFGDQLICLRVTICWSVESKEIVFGVLSIGRSKSGK